jgi:hypothetical protein
MRQRGSTERFVVALGTPLPFCRGEGLCRGDYVAKHDFWRHNCQLTQSGEGRTRGILVTARSTADEHPGGCRAKQVIASFQGSGGANPKRQGHRMGWSCAGERIGSHLYMYVRSQSLPMLREWARQNRMENPTIFGKFFRPAKRGLPTVLRALAQREFGAREAVDFPGGDVVPLCRRRPAGGLSEGVPRSAAGGPARRG